MLRVFNKNLRRLCCRLRWPARRRSKSKIFIKKYGKLKPTSQNDHQKESHVSSAVIHPSNEPGSLKPIRIATFNAALFSMAPAVPQRGISSNTLESEDQDWKNCVLDRGSRGAKSMNDHPKGILKHSSLHPSQENLTRQHKFARSRLRVSINLPDNEISLKRNGYLSFLKAEESSMGRILKGKAPIRPDSVNFSTTSDADHRSTRTIVEVLRELDADVLALQDVRAEEEKNMRPLSDLAVALGMKFVFAESWAPEYGNAILSKWPIKRWKAQKIFDDTDFRNVLKATIDVPEAGEINFFCTLLDHLDENWRIKQIDAIIQSTKVPHILAGSLNSLDQTDYSEERWTDIVKVESSPYYDEMGKPTPKVEVMKHLKSLEYTDAKNFSGECESVVVIAKGQSVQGTCKYGTRVDYMLSSSGAPYKFVPGSYSVLSSKGTSDHHIVKVDVIKVAHTSPNQCATRKPSKNRTKTVKITTSSSTKGIWKIQP